VADDDAGAAAAEVIAGFGVGGRRLRLLVALLTERPHTLAQLVQDTAVPRRTVEILLRAIGPDLAETTDGFAIRADRVPSYRDRFDTDRVREPIAEPPAALVAALGHDIAAAPAAREDLDHVSATADTAARRAVWLDGTFDLTGAHVLCVGDHDLTSLALGAVRHDVEITVVDLDERLLDFIDRTAAERGYRVRCEYADLRFGLPDAARDWADLVFTDPPYTPEGVQLFLGRGLQGMRDRANGRLVMAYGFSPLHPALGVKVQRSVYDLDLAVEAILPAFNRYHGAQAVGSASDLYVCRPTARTWQVVERQVAKADVQIYTHGAQSLEGATRLLDDDTADAVRRFATEPSLYIGDSWPDAGHAVPLGTVFSSGVPARRGPVRAAVNLVDDPGPWLLRVLLAVNADRMAVLVPNNHPDLANEVAQRALSELVAAKYTLRLRRSTPSWRTAVVEAVAAEPTSDPTVRRLLTRAHGRIGNLWRESLISESGRALTKNEARTRIAAAVPRQAWLDDRLIDLPRHAIRELLAVLP
jgi:hypothetical protein